MIVRAYLLFAFIFLMFSAGNGAPSELNGIRYNVQPTRSRVTFRFTGTVTYSAGKRDDVITLVFRNVTVGSPPGEARLRFVSGAVQGVRIQSTGKDSAIATIHLRNEDRVAYSASDDGNALYVDVLGGGQRTAAVNIAGKTSATATETEKNSLSPGVPFAAPVTAERTVPPGPPAPRRADPGPSSGSGLLISVLISLIVATAGTLVILRFTVRHWNGKRDAGIQPMGATLDVRTFSLPRVTEIVPPDQERSAVQFSQPETDGDDSALTLAERFKRSRSELDFAIQLSSLPYPNPTGKELIATQAASLSKAQRTVIAKKLGVGRGELDLIANLSRMQEQAKERNHD